MEMKIRFPGQLRVDAEYKGFTIQTDQPGRFGGDDSAPAPFDLFLSSLGTCAGFYVMKFLTQRDLPMETMTLTLETEKDPATKQISKVLFRLDLPKGFPTKYERAIVRAIDQCSVKQHILDPPEFETIVSIP